MNYNYYMAQYHHNLHKENVNINMKKHMNIRQIKNIYFYTQN